MDVVYFVVLVGILVFVHELGHFAWAKFFGVRVLKFSLGFGPKLAGFRRGGTEYVIAAVPLGGYVKMLGEHPSDAVPAGQEPSSFHHQPLWKRLVIVVAGPAMNLVFPLMLFSVVYLGDDQLPAPIIGSVFAGGPAEGKLQPGDRVLSIDDTRVETFYDVSQAVSAAPGQSLRFTVRGAHSERPRRELLKPVTAREHRDLDLASNVGRIGVSTHRPAAVIGTTSPTGPAANAGLRPFDLIVSAGGEPVESFMDLERVLGNNRGLQVPLTYFRPTPIPHALGGLATMEVYQPRITTMAPDPSLPGSSLDRGGIEPVHLYVSHVEVGSAEHRLGVLPGDRLMGLDGKPLRHFQDYVDGVQQGEASEHELTWRRDGEVLRGTLSLRRERGVGEHGERYDRYAIGIGNWVPTTPGPRVANPSPIFYALRRAIASTAEMTELTVVSVVRLVQGRVSVKSLGGPLSILEAAGTAAREGTLDYLRVMAFISINLGLINLLPIPLLDGGHILFFLIESLRRRPLSIKTRQYASLAGLSLLIVLMLLAFKNDLERQWPELVQQSASE